MKKKAISSESKKTKFKDKIQILLWLPKPMVEEIRDKVQNQSQFVENALKELYEWEYLSKKGTKK